MCAVYGQDVLGDRFVNNAGTTVVDSLLGTVYSNPNVGLFDFGKVVVRRDYATEDIVKVVSGGPSGHEPAHAGFVGKGMLTAAVQGDIFSSPPSKDVLRTIREISYKKTAGVLLIVQNHKPDCLSFGLAAERARNQDIAVKVLVVAEDCRVIDHQQGKHGVGGIILLNKIAGAMAEANCSLEDTFQFCQKVHQNMSSVVLSLTSSVPSEADTCICARTAERTTMEIGPGLHGEPGLIRLQMPSVSNACRLLFETITKTFPLHLSRPLVILVNNLGKMMQMEELTVVKEFVSRLHEKGILVARVYHGQFLTALNMKGFSVTVLKVIDPKVLQYLDASCEAVAWGTKNINEIRPDAAEPIRNVLSNRRRAPRPGPALTAEHANIVVLALQFACDALVSCEKQINVVDSESGSGTMGSKIKSCIEMVFMEVKKKALDFVHPKTFFEKMSSIAEKTMCGPLGLLYGIVFVAAANSFGQLSEDHTINVRTWLQALMAANGALKSYVTTEHSRGTMYDPLQACAAKMEEALQSNVSGLEAFSSGVTAAEEVAFHTRQPMKKYPDSGAHVVGVWMRAVCEGIKMKCDS